MTKNRKNISDFSSHKVISKWEKPRSPYSVLFLTSDPEKWFIEVLKYRKGSGEIQSISTIIESDLETWEKFIRGDGWKKLTID